MLYDFPMSTGPRFDQEFLTPNNTTVYRESISKTVEALIEALPRKAYSGKSPSELAKLLAGDILPRTGSSIDEALKRARNVIANSAAVTHPYTIAHLHCPPLIASLAADVLVSALNQSMDSFDEAPSATMMELAMTKWLCAEAGLPSGSDAVFTSGGTQSNFMALLLARDACIASRWDWSAQKHGLPAQSSQLRFLCSEIAHFTVEKSAGQLGLGTDAVIRIPVDREFRMDPNALEESVGDLQRRELIPAAVVATAGTTDFGSIDPLPEVSAIARKAGAWMHVDAAYGGALLLSERHREKLNGLENADSVGIDFHKEFWQSINCAALLIRDTSQLRHLTIHADYLNQESDEESGVPNLVNKSLATTRRFDVLKLWLSFQILGRQKLGEMVDRTVALAAHAAQWIERNPTLELLHQPQYGCVVFRYRLARGDSNVINADLRRRLLEQGTAVIGHTRVRGQQCLKLTCMNPATSEDDIEKLLQLVVEQGKELEKA